MQAKLQRCGTESNAVQWVLRLQCGAVGNAGSVWCSGAVGNAVWYNSTGGRAATERFSGTVVQQALQCGIAGTTAWYSGAVCNAATVRCSSNAGNATTVQCKGQCGAVGNAATSLCTFPARAMQAMQLQCGEKGDMATVRYSSNAGYAATVRYREQCRLSVVQ
jgi:hypothetical protein